jgi:Putative binding domain, N-terminal/Viral BACON domain
MRAGTFVIAILSVSAVLAACNGASPTPTPTALTITCDATALTAIGQQAHCSARATLTNGQTDDRTASAQWSSSDASKASVSSGVVTAAGIGNAVITASSTGLTAQQQISVSASCTFAVSPTSASFGPAGGSQPVSVTASPAGCTPASWTAAGNGNALTVSPASGSGNGTVTVTTAANGGAAQTATATIAGQTFTATIGAACSYTFQPVALDAPGSWNVSAAINERAVNVGVIGTSCAPWQAETSAGWISVSPSSGSESGAVRVFAAANGGPARSGSLTFHPSGCPPQCPSAVTVAITQAPATATLFVTLEQGEHLSGPYSGTATGPQGFSCTLRQQDSSVTCPPLTVSTGAAVTIAVTLTVATGDSPIFRTVGCDARTFNTCTVFMNSDRAVTIDVGCAVCGTPDSAAAPEAEPLVGLADAGVVSGRGDAGEPISAGSSRGERGSRRARDSPGNLAPALVR